MVNFPYFCLQWFVEQFEGGAACFPSQVQKGQALMIDAPGWIALAVAWIGALLGDFSQQPAVTSCHCNCTCEVEATSCPPSTTWWWEFVKGLVFVIGGLIAGSGYLLTAVVAVIRGLWNHFTISPTPSPLLTVTSTSGPSVEALKALDEGADQRELARRQLEVIRQRQSQRS